MKIFTCQISQHARVEYTYLVRTETGLGLSLIGFGVNLSSFLRVIFCVFQQVQWQITLKLQNAKPIKTVSKFQKIWNSEVLQSSFQTVTNRNRIRLRNVFFT